MVRSLDRIFVNVWCLATAQMYNRVTNPSDMDIFSKWDAANKTLTVGADYFVNIHCIAYNPKLATDSYCHSIISIRIFIVFSLLISK